MAITCQCGNVYNEGFKFCPECAAPNPNMAASNSQKAEETEKKKSFVKVGQSDLATTVTAKIVRNNVPQKPAPSAEECYEDEEDPQEEEQETEYPKEEYYEDEEDLKEEAAEETEDQEEYYEDEEENRDSDFFLQQDSPTVNTNYDPNHDGYYDDRLPLIANEITKTNITDVLIKATAAIVFIAGIILYCIYFLRF